MVSPRVLSPSSASADPTSWCASRPDSRSRKPRPSRSPRHRSPGPLRRGRCSRGRRCWSSAPRRGGNIRGANRQGVRACHRCESTSKKDLVRSLGPDEVIDYRHEEFTNGTQRWDVIIDTAEAAIPVPPSPRADPEREPRHGLWRWRGPLGPEASSAGPSEGLCYSCSWVRGCAG
jgi:hypothetical protein